MIRLPKKRPLRKTSTNQPIKPKGTAMKTMASFAFLAALGYASPEAGAQTRSIWDAQGNHVATWVQAGMGVRTFPDNVDRIIVVWRNTVDINFYAFYESTNCTGQRYFFSGNSSAQQQLISVTQFEGVASPGTPASKGKTFWASQEGVTVSQHKYGSTWDGHETLGNTPQCYRGDDQLYWMTPAVPVDATTGGFSPPFCVARNVGQCLSGKGRREARSKINGGR